MRLIVNPNVWSYHSYIPLQGCFCVAYLLFMENDLDVDIILMFDIDNKINY